ncbi:MAG: PIN domain-containing protein [Candidatus Pacearchaeota archaeon]
MNPLIKVVINEMRVVILDTNFILTCVKQKIDFFNEIYLLGLSIVIPLEVIREIKRIKEKEGKFHLRRDAELSLKIIERNKFKKIRLGSKTVDQGLLKISKKNPDIIIATLDKELKKRIKGEKLVIIGKKKIEIRP